MVIGDVADEIDLIVEREGAPERREKVAVGDGASSGLTSGLE